MSEIVELRAAEVVLDYNVYPRNKVDATHVKLIRAAMRGGNSLPPIVVEGKSRRAVDGFHRDVAALREYGEDATIKAELREYESDAELFLDAVRLNSGHGANLTPYDRVRCLTIADELKITSDDVARALRSSPEELKDMKLRRIATQKGGGLVPLKSGLVHLADRKLSRKQVVGNEQAGGLSRTYYVNEVIRTIEYDLADWSNESFVARLAHLRDLLNGLDLSVMKEA